MKSSGVKRATRVFMPGETIEDALSAASGLVHGINTIYTRLGENVATADEATFVRDHYIDLLQR